MTMDKREFIKKSGLGAFGIMLVPSLVSGATFSANKKTKDCSHRCR